MTNTPFSKQVEIVSDFYELYASDYPELKTTYDLGLPLAFAVNYGGVAENGLTDGGRDWIIETYNGICNHFGVDVYGDYEDINEILDLANA
jgi:hypothetical protein